MKGSKFFVFVLIILILLYLLYQLNGYISYRTLVPPGTTVTETHMLNLERESFMRLLGERKTLERMEHILKTGKPLRN